MKPSQVRRSLVFLEHLAHMTIVHVQQTKIYQKPWKIINFLLKKIYINKTANIVSKTINLGAHEVIPCVPE